MVIVYLARNNFPFVMYCVNGKPRSSLLIESTDYYDSSSYSYYTPVDLRDSVLSSDARLHVNAIHL